MITPPVDDAVALLRAAVDGLLCRAPAPRELVRVLTEVETQRRRLDGVDVRLVAGLDDARLVAEYGRTSTADLRRRPRTDPAALGRPPTQTRPQHRQPQRGRREPHRVDAAPRLGLTGSPSHGACVRAVLG